MADTREPSYGVETIHLDLPALSGALCRRLHDAGIPVTPERSAQLARALSLVKPISRRRLYWTIRAVLVTDAAQLRAFDAVFRAVFGSAPEGFEPADPDVAATAPREQGTPSQRDEPPPSGEQPPGGMSSSAPPCADDEDEDAVDVPLAVASDEERLAAKHFDALEPGELAALYRLMQRLELAAPLRRARREKHGSRGERVDLRRTLRASLRTGGDPVRLARRRRRVEPRRLVLLCDISGSMEPYARAYLQFLSCAAGVGPRTEAFVFATRLTRLTRALAGRHPERAIQRAAAAAPDWSSGTRIGDALKAFNDLHGRRGMAHGAVVVILSDGWERGNPALVGREMERLARRAHRIVWVNPRVSAPGFSPRAGGMVAALPYCDALLSGHSLDALGEVAEAIGAGARAGELPGTSRATPAGEVEEDESWASATPVAGSSVAMPSGYGPSRGKTTPGWSLGGSPRIDP